MKKLLTVLVVMVMPLALAANPIDRSKALQIANEFMMDASIHSASGMHRAPVVHQLSYKDVGFNNLYTFFDDSNGGFVVVAGDDRLPQPVLAYSETDLVNPSTLPELMQVMLQSYEEQIANLPPNYVAAETPERELIYPLVKSTWHQYLPFCYKTPYDNNAGRNTLVGCVALTLSQLMYYYKYPTGTKITIPAYTTYSGYDMPALPPTTFDYSKMHDNYDMLDTRSEVDANDPAVIEVSKLLLYAGCALQMNYFTGGSSATFDTELIAKYFGFDKAAHRLWAGNYPHAIWEDMVYNELKAGRPVPYSAGGVGAQSHQFIIDGYDGNGLFHANIGEIGRGSDNQYYRLGVLDVHRSQTGPVMFSGYNIYQSAIFGFQPDKGNTALPVVSVNYGDYALSKTDFTRTSTSADFQGIVLKGTMTRHDSNGLSMDYGWGLYQGGLLKKVLYSATTSSKTIQLNKSFNMGKGVATGTYQIFPIFRNHGAEEWEPYFEYAYTDENGNQMRHYTAKIESKKLHIGVSSPEPNITINKIDYYSAYVGERLAAQVFVTNGGTNYENNIFYWVDGEMLAGAGLYIDPGQSGDIILCGPAPAKGTHDVKISTDWEGNNVIYTGKLQITAAPTCQLECTYTETEREIDYTTYYSIVRNGLDFTLNIKNVGNTVFNDKIKCICQEYLRGEDGRLTGDLDSGYPRWIWNPVIYLHLEPGETKTLSFSLGREYFRPNDYVYCSSVDYYNKKSTTRIYSSGYFYFVVDSNKPGDVDGDGFVTVTDVLLTVNKVAKDENPAGFIPQNADVNGDGLITVTDVIMIIGIVIGES